MSSQSLYSPRDADGTEQHDIPTPTEPPLGRNEHLQMTMAEWKAIHRDFKGMHKGQDGKRWRTVLRPGGLIHVEIVKE